MRALVLIAALVSATPVVAQDAGAGQASYRILSASGEPVWLEISADDRAGSGEGVTVFRASAIERTTRGVRFRTPVEIELADDLPFRATILRTPGAARRSLLLEARGEPVLADAERIHFTRSLRGGPVVVEISGPRLELPVPDPVE